MIPETICHQIYDLSYYLVSLTRILPVEIEPVKVVLLQEQLVADEALEGLPIV